ncbi:hypothetical protein Plhal304r1_c029g0096331 [Plasmopara halstedii]
MRQWSTIEENRYNSASNYYPYPFPEIGTKPKVPQYHLECIPHNTVKGFSKVELECSCHFLIALEEMLERLEPEMRRTNITSWDKAILVCMEQLG